VTAIDVRRASAGDVAAVNALIEELGYQGLDTEAFARGYAAVLADRSQQVWLAEIDGVVVGLVSMSTRPQIRLAGAILTVDELVVSERARGAGVGTELIELTKREAQRIGARRLELLTARGRASYSRRFYPKNGFVEVDSAVMRWKVPQ
jgi:N-acetylglutamate synthase-like GNAT family acetyltransferase